MIDFWFAFASAMSFGIAAGVAAGSLAVGCFSFIGVLFAFTSLKNMK